MQDAMRDAKPGCGARNLQPCRQCGIKRECSSYAGMILCVRCLRLIKSLHDGSTALAVAMGRH